MSQRRNRTIVCSVLFLDVVEYSRKPVTEQMQLRESFNVLLSEAMQDVAPRERIVLDTGDGAAVNVLGDPEDALHTALKLRELLSGAPPDAHPDFKLRFGINIGPVKLVKDLNGRPNIIGDGINVAQRIMSFSQPGQVLVSRSYYEVVSRLSAEYARLFQYEGSRTDKHVREHEVYAVVEGARIPAKSSGAARTGHSAIHDRGVAAVNRIAAAAGGFWDLLRPGPQVASALAAAVILSGAVGLRIQMATPRAAVTSAAGVDTSRSAARAGGPLEPPVQAALLAAPPLAAEAEDRDSVSPRRARSALVAPTKENGSSPGLATVDLAILPWGEVYVDGRKRGVSPPLRSLKVAPGRHIVEIRNSTFASREEKIEVKAGGRVAIKHNFRKAGTP